MSHRKRKKLHHCKTHPARDARGRCSLCGAWICTECATVQSGQIYCKVACTELSMDAPGDEAPAPSQQPLCAVSPTRPRAWRAYAGLWAGVAFGLCGIALGAWGAYRAATVDKENTVLARQKTMLFDRLTRSRQEAQLLRDSLAALHDSLQRAGAPSGRKIRSAFAALPDLGSVDGLPVSFDNGSTAKKLVALTFDGASYDEAAGSIMDTLASRNVQATMFLTGEFMRHRPDMLRRMLDLGHEVANHTQHHPHLTSWEQDQTHSTLATVSQSFLVRELALADETYRRATGKSMPPLWRAPYGEKNRQICLWARQAGYLHVGWRQGGTWRQNLDSNDWIPDEETPGYHSPQEVYDKIMALAKQEPSGINGGIILLHLGTVRKERDKQVHWLLGRMIDDLRRLGYRFVTVSEMLREAGVDVAKLAERKTAEGGDVTQGEGRQ